MKHLSFCFELFVLVSALLGAFDVVVDGGEVLVHRGLVLLEFVEEEVLDEFVLDVLVLGEDGEDQQGR